MLIPLSILKKTLDNKLTPEAWKDYEVETILHELSLPYSPLLYDKIAVLKVIASAPEVFFEEVLFMIFASGVMNNTAADFEFLPHLTSLEFAFAIVEMAKILGVELHELPLFRSGPKIYLRDLLINEGYSEVLSPFDVVGVGELPKGQEIQDTISKSKAIKEYINAMYNSPAA